MVISRTYIKYTLSENAATSAKYVNCAFHVNYVYWASKTQAIQHMTDPIPASEFTRNFGRYRMLAQREAVAVSEPTVRSPAISVAPDEYEEFSPLQAASPQLCDRRTVRRKG